MTLDTSNAQEEINRIEHKLDAKSSHPRNPPARQHSSGNGEGNDIDKSQSMDTVLIGVVLLLGIGAAFALGERLTNTQKTQISAGAVGAATGLVVGYGVGRFRH